MWTVIWYTKFLSIVQKTINFLYFNTKYCIEFCVLRDWPFNLKGGYGFLFRSEFFFPTTRELEYLFFLPRKVRIFFPEFNIRLYDKNSESIFFFPLSQNQNIFFSNIGNQNIFLEKNHNPPLQVKWSFPKEKSNNSQEAIHWEGVGYYC